MLDFPSPSVCGMIESFLEPGLRFRNPFRAGDNRS